MRSFKIAGLAALFVLAFISFARADNSGRLYAKVTTVDGEVFEGLVRWDKNEGSWVDFLNGNKDREREDRKSHRERYTDRRKKIRIFGIPIGYSTSYSYDYGASQSGMRMGHIKSIEVIDDDAILVILKSGQEVELSGGSTDIGESIREIIIEDAKEGEIELEWEDLEEIEFMQGGADLKSGFGDRLYGKIVTRRGDEFTGWLCWDIDEIFTEDVLDAEADRRRDRKIEFGKIKAVERNSSSSARIFFHDGEELVLRGTNDVDDSNRGIVISEPAIGQIVVGWDEFERAEFSKPAREMRYDAFDGGTRLRGIVYTVDGEEFPGLIRWDDDEEYTWEFLDGNYRDMEFDVEFDNIAEIQRKGYRSSVVKLRDGRSFRFEGSNDVDDDNKGIFITQDDGDEIEVDWDELDRVVFQK